MNREIKFRTWDSEYKELSEWKNRDPFFSTSEGKIFFWDRTWREDGSYDGDVVLQDTGERFILSQYTGLKDSFGKEIYEGDILVYEYNQAECSSFAALESPLKFKDLCVVEYDRGAFRFKGDKFGCVADDCEQMMIVGNIFENFDLLWTEEEKKVMEYKFVNSRENEY